MAKSGKPIEQYEHKGKERINNPPVGLVDEKNDPDAGKKTYAYDPHIDPALQFDSQRSEVEKVIDAGLEADTLEAAKEALAELKKRQEPYLNWAGKAEHTTFEVDTVSLHVHERIDPRTIIDAVRKKSEPNPQQSLFETSTENPPIRQAIEFYKHPHQWTNRLVAGDSLLVMNSLLEKEGLGGQVQMIYIDPPYGIKYGSNFQPFVNKREVKDDKDEDLTQEPEMIKAFRDTWELGIHSYLTYLKDRLLLARELLTESGCVFVQISDENIHLVRNLMDEVFGAQNFIRLIPFRKKTMPLGSRHLEAVNDYLVWYGKDKGQVKYQKLYQPMNVEGDSHWNYVELPDGTRRRMIREEIDSHKLLPKDSVVCQLMSLYPVGQNSTGVFPVELRGKVYSPPTGKSWFTNQEGMKRLIDAGRIEPYEDGKTIRYVLKTSDGSVTVLTGLWADTSAPPNMRFVVETSPKVIQRCMLMTTDPGDLVLDPTCGSGTTAYIAEQWGRRWITCDTSRVSIALAKQRLMTGYFDYYELAHSEEGVGSGFAYKKMLLITRGSVANSEPPEAIDLVDNPELDNSKLRVTGPFTLEAVPAAVVQPVDEIEAPLPSGGEGIQADESISRSGETLRQAEWRDELFKTGIRGKGGQKIDFSRVEPIPGTRYLHAEAETKEDTPLKVVISFGSEYAPLEQKQVALALDEVMNLWPKPKIIVFAAFQFDPEAAKDIDETKWTGLSLIKAQMNTDLLTEDLKKKRSSNESFWLIGQPDVRLYKITDGEHTGKYKVEVAGFDYYNTKTGQVESGGTEKIAVWLLDTDYDGRSLFARQVFFPMSDETSGWSKLAKSLKAEIDPELIEAYRGTVSLPFVPGDYKKVAVKIVDDRGIESLKIIEVE